jgi:hypothetical protein
VFSATVAPAAVFSVIALSVVTFNSAILSAPVSGPRAADNFPAAKRTIMMMSAAAAITQAAKTSRRSIRLLEFLLFILPYPAARQSDSLYLWRRQPGICACRVPLVKKPRRFYTAGP